MLSKLSERPYGIAVVTIIVKDAGGPDDINEPPAIDEAAFQLDEGVALGTQVGVLAVSDEAVVALFVGPESLFHGGFEEK